MQLSAGHVTHSNASSVFTIYKINIASFLGYLYQLLHHISMYVVLGIPNVSCGFW